MRVLLSTIGSRGDIQPLVALALEVRALGHDVHLCVPPDFREWLDSLGLPFTPLGLPVRRAAASRAAGASAPPTHEQLRQMADATVATQFETIAPAARGCDVVLALTPLQVAVRSVAEQMGVPYVFAVCCPVILPSPHHAPPPLPVRGEAPPPASGDNRELWARDSERFSSMFGPALNAYRASAGLAPVADVQRHVFTDQPWLASDPALAPWPDPADGAVFQTGAWMLKDERPLSPEVEAFLDAGEPPIYFGFGSMGASPDLGKVMVQAARALRRRALVSRGWADFTLLDNHPDCLALGEINHQALFKRVAAVVHHGGSGTATAAALAGAPQVVVPQMYDQHYFAERIHRLGIGSAHAPGPPSADSLTAALDHALQPDAAVRARSLAAVVRRDGARVAAQRLTTEVHKSD